MGVWAVKVLGVKSGEEIQGEGGCLVSISLTVYDTSRKGEHIKCMTHKSVCASVPHQCPAEWVASTAAVGIKKPKKKNQAISCFTWCGYPISYTKHVAKQMFANASVPGRCFILGKAFTNTEQNSLMKYYILGTMTCICCF